MWCKRPSRQLNPHVSLSQLRHSVITAPLSHIKNCVTIKILFVTPSCNPCNYTVRRFLSNSQQNKLRNNANRTKQMLNTVCLKTRRQLLKINYYNLISNIQRSVMWDLVLLLEYLQSKSDFLLLLHNHRKQQNMKLLIIYIL